MSLSPPQRLLASSSLLTVSGDPAVLVGLSTQIAIQVVLVYAAGSTQDMTNDSWTFFDDMTLFPSNVTRVSRDTTVIVAKGVPGNITLLESFTRVSVTTLVLLLH